VWCALNHVRPNPRSIYIIRRSAADEGLLWFSLQRIFVFAINKYIYIYNRYITLQHYRLISWRQRYNIFIMVIHICRCITTGRTCVPLVLPSIARPLCQRLRNAARTDTAVGLFHSRKRSIIHFFFSTQYIRFNNIIILFITHTTTVILFIIIIMCACIVYIYIYIYIM